MNQENKNKKEQALQDIQKLDKIYSILVNTKFNDQNLYILTDKISDVVNKEISNKMTKNNISHQEYEEAIDKSHIVEMNKDEMIRFYADKIVYDCITDCSENNRIFSVDEYTNNDFIIKNFAEIVKRINLDERVSDLEVDSDKKEIDMVFYLDYCPHYFQEDLDIDDDNRCRYIENFKNYINHYTEMRPDKWIRTNTRELIRDFINIERENEDTELMYNVLNEELYNCGFVEKYLDGYTVTINADNIDELINQLDERINELKKTLEEGEIENE
ncbi:MAG: hypothetical protein HFJ60_04245 [Clostridia bacterium]|jgi:hypothetical protein|nr:hypothetical protein [Clostridia bacterium]